RTLLRTSRSLNARRGKIRSPEPNFTVRPAREVDLVDSATEREDSDQQDPRGTGALHQRHVPLRLSRRLRTDRVVAVFTDLVSLHFLISTVLRFGVMFCVD